MYVCMYVCNTLLYYIHTFVVVFITTVQITTDATHRFWRHFWIVRVEVQFGGIYMIVYTGQSWKIHTCNISRSAKLVFFTKIYKYTQCSKALCSHGLAYIVFFYDYWVVFFYCKITFNLHLIKMYHLFMNHH